MVGVDARSTDDNGAALYRVRRLATGALEAHQDSSATCMLSSTQHCLLACHVTMLCAPPFLLLQGWPAAGAITLRGLELRYRPHLPRVLRGLSLDIPAGSRVAVVGRTGAGKVPMGWVVVMATHGAH